jgi:hypothetical protein
MLKLQNGELTALQQKASLTQLKQLATGIHNMAEYNNYSNGMIAAGNAAGAANAGRSLVNFTSPQAIAGRQEARLLKTQTDEALRRTQATRATDEDLAVMGETQSLAIKDALNQAKIANMTNTRMVTYQGFQQFQADGNPEHINTAFTALRENPVGKNLFAGIARVDKLGPGDEELLKDLGITYQDVVDNPELQQLFLRATMSDGSASLLPVEALYAGTNYNRYQTQQQLELEREKAEIFYRVQGRTAAGSSAQERIAHTATAQQMPMGFPEADWKPGNPEYDAKYLEIYEANRTRPTNETQSEAEATRETLLQRPPEIDEADWTAGNPAYDSAYETNFDGIRARDLQTSGQREQAQVRSIRNSVLERASVSGKDFFDIDFSNRSNRIKYEQDIQDMMRLGKIELSAEDKRTASYVHELLNLGGAAGDMTDQETGLIDRLFRNVKNYVSNDPGGLDMTSAYAAFRNTVRNALFGSALTDGEIAAFNEAFGTLGQQTGPVLTQFKTGLEQVKSRLESLMNTNDSLVSHFYLGTDQREIAEMVEAIDERIAMLDRTQATPGVEATVDVTNPNQPVVETPRPPLDQLYQRIMTPGAAE